MNSFLRKLPNQLLITSYQLLVTHYMALSTKAITNRIKSVKNTKKITKAMEMVAASKMRKAVEKSLASREFAERALELMIQISKNTILRHPLLKKTDGNNVLLVLMASNKGLCGGYHVNIFKEAESYIAMKRELGGKVDVICIGRYAERFAKKHKLDVLGSFVELPEALTPDEVNGIVKLAVDEFTAGTYDKVRLVFAKFISAISQEVVIRGILPIKQQNIERLVKRAGKGEEQREPETESLSQYQFEPGEEEVLNYVLPALTEVQVYQALLESRASEHSSRMVAMKNASDNAGDLIKDLTLSYNKARQAGITQEIIEIATAASAV